MTQRERDGESIPKGVDTPNLRYVGNDIAEIEKKGLASETFGELQHRRENDVMLSPAAQDRLGFPVPVFVDKGAHVFFWAFDLVANRDYDDFRTELPSDDRSPSWAIGKVLKAAIVGEFSLLSRDARNVFEIEDDELLVVEFTAGRFWKVYLMSDMPDFTFDEGDRFFVVVDMMSV